MMFYRIISIVCMIAVLLQVFPSYAKKKVEDVVIPNTSIDINTLGDGVKAEFQRRLDKESHLLTERKKAKTKYEKFIASKLLAQFYSKHYDIKRGSKIHDKEYYSKGKKAFLDAIEIGKKNATRQEMREVYKRFIVHGAWGDDIDTVIKYSEDAWKHGYMDFKYFFQIFKGVTKYLRKHNSSHLCKAVLYVKNKYAIPACMPYKEQVDIYTDSSRKPQERTAAKVGKDDKETKRIGQCIDIRTYYDSIASSSERKKCK